jgi:hypothetical protein
MMFSPAARKRRQREFVGGPVKTVAQKGFDPVLGGHATATRALNVVLLCDPDALGSWLERGASKHSFICIIKRLGSLKGYPPCYRGVLLPFL